MPAIPQEECHRSARQFGTLPSQFAIAIIPSYCTLQSERKGRTPSRRRRSDVHELGLGHARTVDFLLEARIASAQDLFQGHGRMRPDRPVQRADVPLVANLPARAVPLGQSDFSQRFGRFAAGQPNANCVAKRACRLHYAIEIPGRAALAAENTLFIVALNMRAVSG